jgi:hypothetical protein
MSGMATITGKNGSITYEISSQDPEIGRLLQEALSVHVNALVNHDKERLQSILSKKPQTKAKDPASQTPQEKYATENLEEPELIPLGGKWAYSVALISNKDGQKVVRISKGQIQGNFYRDKKTDRMVLTPDDPMRPISQANHINIKRLEEWEKLQEPVVSRLRALEENKQ